MLLHPGSKGRDHEIVLVLVLSQSSVHALHAIWLIVRGTLVAWEGTSEAIFMNMDISQRGHVVLCLALIFIMSLADCNEVIKYCSNCTGNIIHIIYYIITLLSYHLFTLSPPHVITSSHHLITLLSFCLLIFIIFQNFHHAFNNMHRVYLRLW